MDIVVNVDPVLTDRRNREKKYPGEVTHHIDYLVKLENHSTLENLPLTLNIILTLKYIQARNMHMNYK